MTILVTFESIARTADDVDTTAKFIDTSLDDLRQFLAPMVASWTGSAAVEYQDLQRRWNEAVTDLNVVLRQIARNLRTANETYLRTEAANAGVWGR